MTLDGTIYSDPVTFNPARFLPKPEGNGEPHPGGSFGFGRRYYVFQEVFCFTNNLFRICPGRHLANASLWIAIASTLATLKISKAKDRYGKEITPEVAFTSGIARFVAFPIYLYET